MLKWKNKKLVKGQITKQLIRNTSAYALLGVASLAMVFLGLCTPNQGGPVASSGIPAKVAGEVISVAEFRSAYRNYEQYYRSIYQDRFDAAAINLSRVVLDGLVDARLYAEFAKTVGVAADDAEVKKSLAERFKKEDGKFDSEAFNNTLLYSGFTEKNLYDDVERQIRVRNLRTLSADLLYVDPAFVELQERMAGIKMNLEFVRIQPKDVKVSVTPADVKAFLAEATNEEKIKTYYEKNSSEFNKEKRVKARHLLVAYAGARRAPEALKTTKEQALAKANSLLPKAKSASEKDWIALIKANTDEESGKKSGGDLGFFGAADMVKEFSDVAYKLEKGQTSDVVESPFGFHIMRVEDIQDAVSVPLEQAKEKIARELIIESKQPQLAAARAEEVRSAAAEGGAKASAKLAEYGLKWDETGEFGLEDASIPKLGADQKLFEAAFALQKAGEISAQVLTVSEQQYILRLKNRSAPAPKMDRESVLKFQQELSYKLFTQLSDDYKKTMKDSDQVSLNNEFRDLSLQQQAQ